VLVSWNIFARNHRFPDSRMLSEAGLDLSERDAEAPGIFGAGELSNLVGAQIWILENRWLLMDRKINAARTSTRASNDASKFEPPTSVVRKASTPYVNGSIFVITLTGPGIVSNWIERRIRRIWV